MKVSTFVDGGMPSRAAEMLVAPWFGKGPVSSARVPDAITRSQLSMLGDFSFDEYIERHGDPLKKGNPVLVPLSASPLNQKTRFLLLFPLREEKWGKIRGHDIRRFAEDAVRWASDQGCSSVGFLLDGLYPWTKEGSPVVEALVEAASLALYRFDECRSKPEKKGVVKELALIMKDEHPHLESNIQVGQQIAEGICLARDLILLPPNWKRPVQLAERIGDALISFKDVLTVSVMDQFALKKLGANGILAVGGAGEPVLVRIAYHPPHPLDEGRPPQRPIALIGKGVTMDTGGYGIKPAAGQRTMKGDCAGAAAVVGTMRAIAALRPRFPVVAYLPFVENLISERAMLTSDVYTALNGKTVEVMHTDAEGRLILADALALACREEKPRVVIDIATLTGAVVAATGPRYAGLFSTTEILAGKIARAGRGADEHFCRLPLVDEYLDLLQGGVADLRNIGNGPDALLAAIFLRQFVTNNVQWAHLDIAGVFGENIEKGKVPGFGVGTLTRFVLHGG